MNSLALAASTFEDSPFTIQGGIAIGVIVVSIAGIVTGIVQSATGWSFSEPPVIKTTYYDAGFSDYALVIASSMFFLGGVAHAAHGNGGFLSVLIGVTAGMLIGWLLSLRLRRLSARRRGIDTR